MWSDSRSGRFTAGKIFPVPNGEDTGPPPPPRTGMAFVNEKKILCWESNRICRSFVPQCSNNVERSIPAAADDSNWRKCTSRLLDPTSWCSWLRHCASSRKVVGSVGIFHWLNPSGSTQPLTDMSTNGISCGGNGVHCVGLRACTSHVYG